MNYKVKSPILFLVFNRPDKTRQVFDVIKQVQPAKLYIAADGPRFQNAHDIILCEQTRSIINEIDWECELKTLFHEDNRGCKIAVSNNISWFFEQEPEGIILEDDCLPNQKFFEFCDDLLLKYRFDNRVRHINGANLSPQISSRPVNTYYFSKLSNVWGWASWRRVWNDYDVNMSLLTEAKNKNFLSVIFKDHVVEKDLLNNFKRVQSGVHDTWDFQYLFCNLINNGLSINPNYNMITNIGFNNDATHTRDEKSLLANIPLQEYSSLVHEQIFIPEIERDIRYLKGSHQSSIDFLISYLKGGIKKIFKK